MIHFRLQTAKMPLPKQQKSRPDQTTRKIVTIVSANVTNAPTRRQTNAHPHPSKPTVQKKCNMLQYHKFLILFRQDMSEITANFATWKTGNTHTGHSTSTGNPGKKNVLVKG